MPKLELSQRQAEAYASEVVEVGGPILDISTDLGDEPKQKIFEGGELTQAGQNALIYFTDRTLDPKNIDDNCMMCQAQNEFPKSETALNVFCELKDLSASKCCTAEMQDGQVVVTDTDPICQTGMCANVGQEINEKYDLYKMCIRSMGRFMGQINYGYSDFQGQGNSGYMCGKDPQLQMGAQELQFNVKQPVEGVKDFTDMGKLPTAVGGVSQTVNPSVSEIQVELKKEWKMQRKPIPGSRRLQEAPKVGSDSLCIFDILSDFDQKVTLDTASPHKYYLVNYTEGISLTPIGDDQYEFSLKKSDKYDLVGIFEKASVPTTISYGSLNEKRLSCSVRIDTSLDGFKTYGGEEKFEQTMAKELGVE